MLLLLFELDLFLIEFPEGPLCVVDPIDVPGDNIHGEGQHLEQVYHCCRLKVRLCL